MKALLVGSTGLLGQAFGAELARRGWTVCAAARRHAPLALDVTDPAALETVLEAQSPDLVVNCAALVDIAACESDPGAAYAVNARPLAPMAEWSRARGRRLIQVSTDHYFPEGGAHAHGEGDAVSFVNEYARTKFAGEAFALADPGALVLRTSIVGIRGWEKPTFAEWALDVVLHDREATLFSDAFTSSIDVAAFCRAALDLDRAGGAGLFNLAAGEVYSKEAFVRELARQLGRPLRRAKQASVASLSARRASSLGLDVSRAEASLGYRLPKLESVVAAVIEQSTERSQG